MEFDPELFKIMASLVAAVFFLACLVKLHFWVVFGVEAFARHGPVSVDPSTDVEKR